MKDQQLYNTTINTNLRMVRAFLYGRMQKSAEQVVAALTGR